MAKPDATNARRLRSFGYTNLDIADMADDEAVGIITNKTYKPGTKRAVAAIAAATGHVGVPEHYTNEGEAARIADKPVASAFVIRSDYEGDLQARAALIRAGAQAPSPQDEIAQPYVDANPDRAFRWLSPQHVEKRGMRGYQPVYDDKGKKVTHLNEARMLAHKPKDVRDAQLNEYRERSRLNQQAARDSAIEAGHRMEAQSGGQARMVGANELTRLIERKGR